MITIVLVYMYIYYQSNEILTSIDGGRVVITPVLNRRTAEPSHLSRFSSLSGAITSISYGVIINVIWGTLIND